MLVVRNSIGRFGMDSLLSLVDRTHDDNSGYHYCWIGFVDFRKRCDKVQHAFVKVHWQTIKSRSGLSQNADIVRRTIEVLFVESEKQPAHDKILIFLKNKDDCIVEFSNFDYSPLKPLFVGMQLYRRCRRLFENNQNTMVLVEANATTVAAAAAVAAVKSISCVEMWQKKVVSMKIFYKWSSLSMGNIHKRKLILDIYHLAIPVAVPSPMERLLDVYHNNYNGKVLKNSAVVVVSEVEFFNWFFNRKFQECRFGNNDDNDDLQSEHLQEVRGYMPSVLKLNFNLWSKLLQHLINEKNIYKLRLFLTVAAEIGFADRVFGKIKNLSTECTEELFESMNFGDLMGIFLALRSIRSLSSGIEFHKNIFKKKLLNGYTFKSLWEFERFEQFKLRHLPFLRPSLYFGQLFALTSNPFKYCFKNDRCFEIDLFHFRNKLKPIFFKNFIRDLQLGKLYSGNDNLCRCRRRSTMNLDRFFYAFRNFRKLEDQFWVPELIESIAPDHLMDHYGLTFFKKFVDTHPMLFKSQFQIVLQSFYLKTFYYNKKFFYDFWGIRKRFIEKLLVDIGIDEITNNFPQMTVYLEFCSDNDMNFYNNVIGSHKYYNVLLAYLESVVIKFMYRPNRSNYNELFGLLEKFPKTKQMLGDIFGKMSLTELKLFQRELQNKWDYQNDVSLFLKLFGLFDVSTEIKTCSICLCDCDDLMSTVKLICGHHFCEMCIDRWFDAEFEKKPNTNTCPNCRFEIDSKEKNKRYFRFN